MLRIVLAVFPLAAFAVTGGWENVSPKRAEFPVSRSIWMAKESPDPLFRIDKREGAEGEIVVSNGVISIRKTNAKGYLLVTAPSFAVPSGTNDVRLLADVEVEDADVSSASGFLRAYGAKEKLAICGLLERNYFATGGGPVEMRGMLCSAPGTAYRKYAHFRATDGRVTPVIVVCGTPSVSIWKNWTVEDLPSSKAVWERHYRTMLAKDHSHERTDEDAFNRTLAADCDHTAEIRRENGFSRFYVDGKPTMPVLYKGKHMMDDGSAAERFAGRPLQRNGIKLMVKEIGLWSVPGFPGFGDRNGFDMRACVEEIRNAMRIADESLFLLTIDATAYPELSAEYPDEIWLKADGSRVLGSAGTCTSYKAMGVDFDGGKVWPWISYASPSWRRLVCDKIRQIVAALKETGLSKRIIGVHFAGFHDSQFSSPYPDFSACARAEYERFLREPNIASTNYVWFSKQIGFRAQEEFTRTFKRAMGKPVVAVRWCESAFMNYPPCACDVTSFVNSDAIDILVAQPSYAMRRPGMACNLRQPLASFHLHGKMYWEEFDIRTYGALEPWASPGIPAVKGLGMCEDIAMWRTVYRKLAGPLVAKRMGWWFYDMGGGWFYPDEIASDIGSVTRLAESLRRGNPSGWKPGVAIVVDEAGQKMWNSPADGFSPAVCDIYSNQMLFMGSSGVPYDVYLADDLLRDPSVVAEYRMLCFAHFNRFDEPRKALIDHLSKAGKTLLFFPESGFLGGSEVTGFDVKTVYAKKSIRVMPEPGVAESVRSLGEITSERNFSGAYPQEAFVDRRTHLVERPGQKVLARYAEDGSVALAETDVGTSHRIYVCAQGGITPALFNRWARESGAYVPIRPGVQVDMSGDFISLHCLRPGHYEFTLPVVTSVENLATGLRERPDGRHLPLDLSAGETCWFRLTSPSDDQ